MPPKKAGKNKKIVQRKQPLLNKRLAPKKGGKMVPTKYKAGGMCRVHFLQGYTWLPADGLSNPDLSQRRRCQRTSGMQCQKIGAVWYPVSC